MRIQIVFFSLLIITAGIVCSAAVPIEMPKAKKKKGAPVTISADFNLLKGQPDHILKNISSNLSDADLSRFGLVSRDLHAIAQAEFATRASWLWKNGKIVLRSFQVTNMLASVFVSNDGKIITDEIDKNHRIRVWQWDGDSYKQAKEIVDRDLIALPDYEHATFCPEKNLLAIIHGSKLVNIWDIQTGNKISQFQIDEAFNYRNFSLFSPDGRTLAMPTRYHGVKVWDIMTGKLKQICGRRNVTPSSLTFSSDGKKLAFGFWQAWMGIIWNVETKGKTELDLQGLASDLFFTNDGRLIEFYDPFGSGAVLFDVQNKRQISKLENYRNYGEIYEHSFSHNGVIFAAWSLSKSKIVLWHTPSGKIIRELGPVDTPGLVSLLFSADDKMIVAGCDNGDILVWEALPPEEKKVKSSK